MSFFWQGLAMFFYIALAACGKVESDRPLDVTVIGDAPAMVDPSRTAPNAASAALLGATAQGLVSFDPSGQIEPGLAERWIVYDQGRSFIFRLRDATWPDGSRVTAADVARDLRAIADQRGRNPLKPLLGAIDEISAVTPQVIEMDLHSPRPYLLQILAQPEAAILHGTSGAGPMQTVSVAPARIKLRQRSEIAGADTKADPAQDVLLRGQRAAVAIIRFKRGETDAVLGGTIADLPLVRAAGLPPSTLRFDPVNGLLGLAFSNVASGFVADPGNRRALAMAVDRDAIGAAFSVPGWIATTGVVPPGRPDLATPAQPDWAGLSLDERRADARAQVARSGTGAPIVRVAMPAGSGARLLFALVARSWQAIGVTAEQVLLGAPADLVLLDRVAPSDSANFYLRSFACEARMPCTPDSERALDASRAAPTLADRTRDFADADRLIVATTPYIALGQPVRWSLISAAAAGWRPSPRGIHPLASLRAPRR